MDTIIAGIQHAGKKQVEQITRDAELQISKLKKESQEKSDQQKQRMRTLGQAQLQHEQALIMQQATMECLQIHADARQLLLERTIEAVKNSFNGIRKRKIYPKILLSLVDEAISAIKSSLTAGQSIILHLDQRDKVVFESVFKHDIPYVSLAYDLHCWGGCNAETEDGLVRVLNTINSRFEHALPIIQMKLSIFFEEKAKSS